MILCHRVRPARLNNWVMTDRSSRLYARVLAPTTTGDSGLCYFTWRAKVLAPTR